MGPTVRLRMIAVFVVLVLSSHWATTIDADGPPQTDEIAGYVERIGHQDATKIRSSDFQRNGEALTLQPPSDASEIAILQAFLQSELGHWGANARFVLAGEYVLFEPKELDLRPFEVTATPSYSFGDPASVMLLHRPMWISMAQTGYGTTIELELDDGITRGQPVFIAASWLSHKGIGPAGAVHEDGSRLDLAWDEEAEGYWLDVPHFSFIYIGVEGQEIPPLEPKIRQAGVTFDFQGEIRYFADSMILELDVAEELVDTDLLLPKDWIHEYIPRPHPVAEEWTNETIDGEEYHVISFVPSQTPLTQVIEERPWDVHDVGLNVTAIEANLSLGLPITLPIGPNETITLPFQKVLANRTNAHRLANGSWENTTGAYLLTHRDGNRSWGQIAMSGDNGHGILCRFDKLVAFVIGESGTPKIQTRAAECDPGGEDPPPPPPPPQCSDDADNDGDGKIDYPDDPGCSSENDDDESDEDQGPQYPYDPPEIVETRTVSPTVVMDQSYRDNWDSDGDASDHAGAALSHMEQMWDTYTGNSYPIRWIVTGGTIGLGDGDDDCERLLDGFGNYLDDEQIRDHVDNTFHMLVSGAEENFDVCIGAAWGNSNPGNFPSDGRLDSINLGVDLGSYKGGSMSTHLGKLIAQEVGHNWGEPNHSCGAVGGEESIMCSGSEWSARKFWLHYDDADMPGSATDSRSRIISGSANYDD